MIECTPLGLCSWDFRLKGEDCKAVLSFNWFGEEGKITANGVAFEVRKHGMFSGSWSLDREGRRIISAQKQNIFTRTFRIYDAEGPLLFKAVSAFGRGFVLLRENVPIASIATVHLFTRRATIETGDQNLAFETLCFSFWLVVLMWRRNANKNSNNA